MRSRRRSREPLELAEDLLRPLRDPEPPPPPAHLVTRVLGRVRTALLLRDAVDLATAGFARVIAGGWIPRLGSTRPRTEIGPPRTATPPATACSESDASLSREASPPLDAGDDRA